MADTAKSSRLENIFAAPSMLKRGDRVRAAVASLAPHP